MWPMNIRPKSLEKAPLNIFTYENYKAFLLDVISSYPKGGRGLRAKLAQAMNCQVAYVSHVFKGNYHLSLEQAEAASRFFALNKEEGEYFLLLVSQQRAGSRELRSFFDRALKDKRDQISLLKSRVKISERIGAEEQSTYYSHWYYAAIHMLITIPEFQTAEKISKRLKLSQKKVNEVLGFLVGCNLLRKEGLSYRPGSSLLHLEKDSPLIARHHSNWRMSAITSLSEEKENDLHYSGVVTCSEKDRDLVREKIAKCLEDCISVIKASPEEKLMGICLDWFEV